MNLPGRIRPHHEPVSMNLAVHLFVALVTTAGGGHPETSSSQQPSFLAIGDTPGSVKICRRHLTLPAKVSVIQRQLSDFDER